jgi:hypothetical protein
MQDRHEHGIALTEHLLKRSTVQRVLVAEVVVKERLIDLGGLGDGIGAGSGYTLAGELADSGLQNRSATLLRLSPRSQPRPCLSSGHRVPAIPALTNQLVRL